FDVTNAQVQLATAELNRVTARNNVSLGRETLRNALGLLGPLDFDIVDSLEQPRSEVGDAEALDLAYATRPALKSLAAQERADKGLQQARENLTLAEGRYKTGVGNIIELTDAQVSLATAEASRVQALVGYRTALAALERSTAHRFGTE